MPLVILSLPGGAPMPSIPKYFSAPEGNMGGGNERADEVICRGSFAHEKDKIDILIKYIIF